MAVTAADIATLSRLLDEAIDLPVEARTAWLKALKPAEQPLAPMLRDMLAGLIPADFMQATPQLGECTRMDDEPTQTGDQVGPYRLIRELGRGGMGAVWLAERADGTLQREVALKLPRQACGFGLAERMQRERDIGALLEHPHIARLYDAGVDPRGRPYLAFEYIAGVDIDRFCDARGLSVADRLQLFVQVARAVAYAHARLVVHRDLKPSNVLVTEDGRAHLLDFGIAKRLHAAADATPLTQDQGRMLTPQYASPEQLRGETITVVSDVYSLGVLLYKLLTGCMPYQPKRQTLGGIEEAILQGEPALASTRVVDRNRVRALRGELDAILSKALRCAPRQRYQTVDALVDDIERHLTGERVLARPDSTWYRMSRMIRRHRLLFAMAAVTALAVVLGAALSVWQAHRAQAATERSRALKEFMVDVFRANIPQTPADAAVRHSPAEALLQRGAQLIASRFPDQPQLQVDLYNVICGIFLEMGATQWAAEYAQRHLDALTRIDANHAEVAAATLQLGNILLRRDRLNDAGMQADRAIALAGADRQLRLKALALQAMVLARLGRLSEAAARADEVEAGSGASALPSVARAQARWVKAEVLHKQNLGEQAFQLYRSAIDDALAAEGPLSATAIDVRLAFVYVLLASGRVDEARLHRDAALGALRASGGAADIRAALEESNLTLQLYWEEQIPFSEARAVIERDRAVIQARGTLVPESIAASIDFDLGWAHLAWGNLAMAEPLLLRSTEVLRRTRENHRDAYFVAEALGWLAQDTGRHADADRSLREALASRPRFGDAVHPWAVWDYLGVANNLSMQGRFDDAEALLRSAPKFGNLEGAREGSSPATSKAIQRGLARLSFERGDALQALGLLPPDEIVPDSKNAEQLQLRGEILCAIGRSKEGLPRLEEALTLMSRSNYEHSPYVAHLRSMTGLCALAQGQRARAQAQARLARTAFEAQPGVSAYFKRPLARLEQLLRRG